MKCAICKNGVTKSGKITVVLEKQQTTLIFKGVPAEVCENCGEEYISSEVNGQLLKRSNDALERNVSLELLQYAA
ncbi:type II toxin-antitoxin system MqsA family antitoxin [bacterium]|nr:type II toxin-antitoxin system MqsA family antitoxin [bacterium]